MKIVRVKLSPEAEEVYKHLNENVIHLNWGESEIEIIAFVLDVIDHHEYNGKFGYRGK